MYTLSDGTQRKYRALITIPTAGIGSGGVSSHVLRITQDCFSPACLAAITAGGATAMQADGGDVCYTAADGVTRLATDIIKHSLNANPASTLLEHAIEYGSYSSAVDNQRYVYWGGNGSETQPAAGAAYGQYAVYESAAKLVMPFQEGSGTTSGDRTSNANNGTLNGVTWVSGGGVTFDGVNHYVTVTDSSSIRPDFISVSFRINVIDADNVTFPIPVMKTPVNANYGFVIGATNAPLFRIDTTINNNVDAVSASTVSSSWESWVGTFDGSFARFFRNGAADGASGATGTLAKVSGDLIIGGPTGFSFSGMISSFRIYSRAITIAEALTTHNNDSSPGTFAVVGAVQSSSNRRGTRDIFGTRSGVFASSIFGSSL